ncbi:hypothetical protein EVAR_4141_1 [Eumeta japonica]|uniref:Uncharacterized protein n=1 Tax=Eumeta variegata TaxID=151549 RepID=A0A4C1TGX4_EUMVA|nr:hypothetical protein EVAR_4141_1 [Eumeta japonica]
MSETVLHSQLYVINPPRRAGFSFYRTLAFRPRLRTRGHRTYSFIVHNVRILASIPCSIPLSVFIPVLIPISMPVTFLVMIVVSRPMIPIPASTISISVGTLGLVLHSAFNIRFRYGSPFRYTQRRSKYINIKRDTKLGDSAAFY